MRGREGGGCGVFPDRSTPVVGQHCATFPSHDMHNNTECLILMNLFKLSDMWKMLLEELSTIIHLVSEYYSNLSPVITLLWALRPYSIFPRMANGCKYEAHSIKDYYTNYAN